MAQLTPAKLNAMTKADIIGAIYEGVTLVTANLTQREDGENLLLEETTTDAYGVLLGTGTVEWTYYPPDEADEIIVTDGEVEKVIRPCRVDEITVTEKDAEGKVMGGYLVKHPKGGQPTLANINCIEPIPIGKG